MRVNIITRSWQFESCLKATLLEHLSLYAATADHHYMTIPLYVKSKIKEDKREAEGSQGGSEGWQDLWARGQARL